MHVSWGLQLRVLTDFAFTEVQESGEAAFTEVQVLRGRLHRGTEVLKEAAFTGGTGALRGCLHRGTSLEREASFTEVQES